MKIKSPYRWLIKLNHESLSKQGPFWLSICIPLIIAILLSYPLYRQTVIDLSVGGYENFLTIFKLPIGVLSLTIPFVAIVAHIHRTIQTAEQLNVARKKNLSDSFFSHHKFITDALGKVTPIQTKIAGSKFDLKIDDPYYIYNIFFKKSSYEKGIDTSSILSGQIVIITLIQDVINKLDIASSPFSSNVEQITRLHNLISSISKLARFLSITNSSSDWKNVVMYGKNDNQIVKLVTFYHNENELKEYLNSLYEIIKKIFLIINIDIDIDNVRFLSYRKTTSYNFYFEEIFKETRHSKENTSYTVTNNLNSELNNEYLLHQSYIYF
ncbi:TPA: hypothetical protein ACPZO3_000230 [Yersinia enterocolitica]